jgi:hypothetical protein
MTVAAAPIQLSEPMVTCTNSPPERYRWTNRGRVDAGR